MKNIFLVLTILFSVTLTFGQHEHHEFSEPDFMLNENGLPKIITPDELLSF